MHPLNRRQSQRIFNASGEFPVGPDLKEFDHASEQPGRADAGDKAFPAPGESACRSVDIGWYVQAARHLAKSPPGGQAAIDRRSIRPPPKHLDFELEGTESTVVAPFFSVTFCSKKMQTGVP
jgi:hypothetical protein